jgi:hypothetical protein
MKKETVVKYENALEYYKQCKSITKTAKNFKIGAKWFAIYLKDKVEIINHQNKLRFNQDIFEVIDTEEKAYWLGFMYADGYVAKNSNNIELSLKLSDKEHLEKFTKFLSKTTEVKTDSFRCRVGFKNKKMRKDLINLGCISNKSLILNFPTENQVPNDLTHHFIRGYIDGDGSIMYRINKTYISPIISILGTKEFLLKLRETMKWKELKLHHKTHNTNTFFISYSGIYVHDMLDSLYKNSKIYLTRKYNKYLFIKNCRSEKKFSELLESKNGED